MATDIIYAYCLLNTQPDLHQNMNLRNLKSIAIDDYIVVVKFVFSDEFSEENFKRNLLDIDWLEYNNHEHVEVITLLMNQITVIPFKFGTLFNNENSLKKFITDHSDSLIENFLHIDGKEEWSVKIYCNRKALSEQIDELSEEMATLEKQIMASSPGKAFLLKRKKSELVEYEMDRICKSYGQNYYDEFRKLSASTNLNNLLPKEFTGREDTMILNAVFLVNKANVNDFRNTVNTFRKAGISDFFIETTGPGPPFSFVYIKANQ